MPPKYLWNFTCAVWKLHRKIVFSQWQTQSEQNRFVMGHFFVLVSLRCRAWQISAVELELPDSETFSIRSLLHTMLPWGRLPECTGKSTARHRDFPDAAQSSQNPEQAVGQIRAGFEGWGGSGSRAKLRRSGVPSSAGVYQLREPVLPLCWADTTCLSHTHICGIGQLSWA